MYDLLVLEVFQLFGIFFAVLILNNCLNVLAILGLLDFLLEFLVQMLKLNLLQILLPNACLLLSMLLGYGLSYLLRFLRPIVSLGVEILGISFFHLFLLHSLLHLHLDILLVFKVLQPPHLLLDLEGLFLRGYLRLKLLFLNLFLQTKLLKLIVDSLFRIRFCLF
jgi:hypothetical protein